MDTLFTPVPTPGSYRVDMTDMVVFFSDTSGLSWRDNLPNHRDAAVKRCAVTRYRRRDAQTAHAKLLIDLVLTVRRDPEAFVPVAMQADVAEVLEAIAIDEARKIELRDRALACVATGATA